MLSTNKRDFQLNKKYFITLFFFLFVALSQAKANDTNAISTSENLSPQFNNYPAIPIIELPPEESIRAAETESPVTPEYQNLTQKIATYATSSDLIFHGQIVDVEYQMAETDGDGMYPLTYITFEIFEVLQGVYETNEIVLMMQEVGWIPSGLFVTNSNTPVLATGDELILFLTQGTINGPVYRHHFFVIDDALYDDDSNEIVSDAENQIWRGRIIPKSKILKRSLGVGTLHMFKKHYDLITTKKQKSISISSKQDVNANYSPLNLQSFSDLLHPPSTSPALTPQTRLRKSASVHAIKSADKQKPLFFSTKAVGRQQ